MKASIVLVALASLASAGAIIGSDSAAVAPRHGAENGQHSADAHATLPESRAPHGDVDDGHHGTGASASAAANNATHMDGDGHTDHGSSTGAAKTNSSSGVVRAGAVHGATYSKGAWVVSGLGVAALFALGM